MIYLDADNVPLIDPANLLECSEYRATGAIFWPDPPQSGPREPDLGDLSGAISGRAGVRDRADRDR